MADIISAMKLQNSQKFYNRKHTAWNKANKVAMTHTYDTVKIIHNGGGVANMIMFSSSNM